MGKIKRWQKALCGAAVLVVIAAFGFMGVEKFSPQERSLRIVEDVSAPMTFNDTDLDIKAKAAVLIDGSSGKVLYAQNDKKHLPPASVTKVMTLLLVMEACDSGKISLDDKVTVSDRAAGMGGSQMYMEAGEQHTVEEILKGVIMVSANDGCVALAEYVSGSVENFVSDMNKRADKMGLNNSNFVNTNGLPVADHYSCAYDIGMISAELMKYKEARKWFTTWQEDIQVGLPGKKSKFTLTNTNKLIKAYTGAIGVKTGYTDDAGYCLSGAAERDGTLLIGVVLGCETSDIRFGEMVRLLDYGFGKYETVNVAEEGKKVKKVNIEKGTSNYLCAVPKDDIKITVSKGERKNIKRKVVIDKVGLPVKKGERVGTIEVTAPDGTVSKHVLVADRKVDRASFKEIYIRMLKEIL